MEARGWVTGRTAARNRMRERWGRAVLIGAAVLTAASGCEQRGTQPSLQVVIGWDTSGSNRPQLPRQVKQGLRILRRLRDTDRVTLYRVDATTQELWDGPPPASHAVALSLLTRELAPVPARHGTQPAIFWRAVAARVAAGSRPTQVVFFTDGEDDGPETAGAAEAVAALARLPQVRQVALCGVRPATRQVLRRRLGPLGDRLTLLGREGALPLSPLSEARR